MNATGPDHKLIQNDYKPGDLHELTFAVQTSAAADLPLRMAWPKEARKDRIPAAIGQ
jgi:hypothetical protein